MNTEIFNTNWFKQLVKEYGEVVTLLAVSKQRTEQFYGMPVEARLNGENVPLDENRIREILKNGEDLDGSVICGYIGDDLTEYALCCGKTLKEIGLKEFLEWAKENVTPVWDGEQLPF